MKRKTAVILAVLCALTLACSDGIFGPTTPLPDCSIWVVSGAAWINGCGNSRAEFAAADYLLGTTADLGGVEVWVGRRPHRRILWYSDAPGWERVQALRATDFPEGTTFRILEVGP